MTQYLVSLTSSNIVIASFPDSYQLMKEGGVSTENLEGWTRLVLCPAHMRLPVRNSLVERSQISRSGEQSQISWAYYSNVVMTNEVVRSVIIM